MSTFLPLERSASQEKATSRALRWIRSSGQGNLQQRGAFQALVSTSIASKMENLPTGHSDCMMSMYLPLKNKQYAMLFSVCTPTLRAEPAEKDKFYSECRSCLQSTPVDKVIILGE